MNRSVSRKIAAVLSLGLVAAGLTMTNAAVAADATPPAGVPTVAYSRVADPILETTPSLAIGSYDYAAAGNLVTLAADTPRNLTALSVVLANWTCQEGYGDAPAGCITTDPSATYDVDVTMSVYAVDRSGETPAVGDLITALTESVVIPFRPTQSTVTDPADPQYCADAGKYFDVDENRCRYDEKHLVTFDGFAGVVLPDEIIVSVGYATPWPSPEATLNIGMDNLADAALVGTDADTIGWPKVGPVEYWGEYNRVQMAVTTATSFTDVAVDHAFYDQIEWLASEGIASGYVDGTFRPAAPVSRQAAAAFLSRWLPTPALAACTEAAFTDVPADHAFCAQITWMSDAGLTSGYGDGTFRPAATVTRQAGAAFIARAVGGELPVCTVAPFTDVPVDHAFCEEIQWMKAEGLSVGYPDGTFGATLPMTRQAMAAWIYAAPAIPVVE